MRLRTTPCSPKISVALCASRSNQAVIPDFAVAFGGMKQSGFGKDIKFDEAV